MTNNSNQGGPAIDLVIIDIFYMYSQKYLDLQRISSWRKASFCVEVSTNERHLQGAVHCQTECGLRMRREERAVALSFTVPTKRYLRGKCYFVFLSKTSSHPSPETGSLNGKVSDTKA